MSLVVFPGRFHNPSEEIVIGHDVIPPLSDDIQLTVEEYRNKLYEVRSVSLHPIGRQNKFNVFITMATEMENKQAVWCPWRPFASVFFRWSDKSLTINAVF